VHGADLTPHLLALVAWVHQHTQAAQAEYDANVPPPPAIANRRLRARHWLPLPGIVRTHRVDHSRRWRDRRGDQRRHLRGVEFEGPAKDG
jgi:hypothetical protein